MQTWNYIRADIESYRRDAEIEVTSAVEGEGMENEHHRERDEASGSDGDVIDEDIQKKGPKKGKQPKKEPKGEDNYIRAVQCHYIRASSITFVHISRRVRHAKCTRHLCKRQSRMGEVSKGNGWKGQSGQ